MQNPNRPHYKTSQKLHFTTSSTWKNFHLLPVRWKNSLIKLFSLSSRVLHAILSHLLRFCIFLSFSILLYSLCVCVSLSLSVSVCVCVCLCIFYYERVRVNLFLLLSQCKKKRHHATYTLHNTTDGKASCYPRRLIITYTHVEQGKPSSIGAFNFQTAIVIMKCYFCRVFSRSFS